MNQKDFTVMIEVPQSPVEVFNAINTPRGWWSEEIEGGTARPQDEFLYHYEDVHRCRIKIVESVPGKKVVWQVLENYFKFTKDKSEWTGTKIIFDIMPIGEKTQMRFTHEGLVPEYECYEICRGAWTKYITESLYQLITTGKGKPNAAGKPQTEDEKRLRSGEHR